MSIKFRRLNHIGQQPFLCALFAYEKAEDGKVYYATEGVSRMFLQDALAEHGPSAVRNFWKALRAELAKRVASRELCAASDGCAVNITWTPRTHEEMCAMLGVEPKRRQC